MARRSDSKSSRRSNAATTVNEFTILGRRLPAPGRRAAQARAHARFTGSSRIACALSVRGVMARLIDAVCLEGAQADRSCGSPASTNQTIRRAP